MNLNDDSNQESNRRSKQTILKDACPIYEHNSKGKIKYSKYGFNIYGKEKTEKKYRICSEIHISNHLEWEKIKNMQY